MPVQHTLFGRPIPHIPPRRVAQLLGSIAVFALLTLVFTLPSSIPGPSLSKFTDGHRISLPKIPAKLTSPSILHPFRPAAHAPPAQENSTSGDASWYSNWNWLSPFSSSVTLDEDRALLPPLPERTRIYTYYDHTSEKDADIKAAENQILVTWRKAWWAQGFKPIILGPADAMNNPQYEVIQKMELEPETRAELLRWLAWEHMGTGILSYYTVLPMGPYKDSLLSHLRRGKYEKVDRYEGMGSALFSGPKAQITTTLKLLIDSKELPKSKDMIKALPNEAFKVDPAPAAIASYDPATLVSKYGKVSEAVSESKVKGLKLLHQLMNAHLHNTWQNIFSKGIIVLKPLPVHTTALIEPAAQLAKFLSQCPDSPIPTSCPPNNPKCKPCVATVPMVITTTPTYQNDTLIYTIGTVPHPYTRITLSSLREKLNVPYLRRSTIRDEWLFTTTKELLGTGVSSSPRVVKFKEAVASPENSARSIWFTAEKALPRDSELDWHFGFAVPRTALDDGKSETPVPGPERRPAAKQDEDNGPPPDEQSLAEERRLLDAAKVVIKSKNGETKRLREAVEAWNLADSEAWRFARAFLARSGVERAKWEEEEKKFAGGAGAEGGGRAGWGRWFDSRGL